MLNYIIKRILQSIPVVFGVLTISFIISYIIPGDPVLAMVGDFYDNNTIIQIKKELGLDQPIHLQYLTYLKNFIKGNLGISFQTKSSVFNLIYKKAAITFVLAFSATIFASILGVLIGVFSAIKFHSIIDRIFIFISLLGISAPVFWIALLLIFYVGVEWRLLPPTGYGNWYFYILPILTLGTRSIAVIARNTRIFMLDILKKDYMRTARAKGLSENIILFKHGLKNLFIPVITIISIDFGSYLSGAVLTESIFGLPGIGRLLLNAIIQRDFPLIQGTVLFMTISTIIINIVIDILYVWLNPKLRDKMSYE